jgi:glucose-6-phosphate 1-dehydrogenase
VKRLLLAAVLAMPLAAQQSATEPTLEQLKVENAQLKLQVAQLKEQLIQMQYQIVQGEKQQAQQNLDELLKTATTKGPPQGKNLAQKGNQSP